jgi:hypothetical protein
MAFKKQEKSECHREAVEMMIVLPKTTRNVGELLSQQHALQRKNNSDALCNIFVSLSFFVGKVWLLTI